MSAGFQTNWLPILVTMGIQLALFAFFMGGIRSQLSELKEEVERLVAARLVATQASGKLDAEIVRLESVRLKAEANHDDIIDLKVRLTNVENGIERGTRRFEEVFRSLASLTKGEAGLPIALPAQRPPRNPRTR